MRKIFLLVALLRGSSALGAITDFSVDHNPIYVGDTVIFNTADNGVPDNTNNFQWEYACKNDGCTGNYVTSFSGPDGGTVNSTLSAVGTYYVRLTVTYSPNDCGVTLPNTVIVHSVAVLPPTGCVLQPGYNAVTPLGSGVWFVFQITAAGNVIYAPGLAQERIYNVSFNPGYDSGWMPASPGTNFYNDGSGDIWDLKVTNPNPQFAAAADGGGFVWSRSQDIRLVMNDCCGQQVIQPLGTFNFATLRDDASDFHIIQQ